MSAAGWPTRSPRVRFDWRVVVVLTSPLLLLPALVLLPVVDGFRLQEARGWPIQTEHLLGLRQRALLDALRDEPPVTRQPDLPLLELRLPRGAHAALVADLPGSGLVERPAVLAWGESFRKVKLRLRGDNAFHWFFPKRSWRLKTRKAEPLAFGRKLHLINPKDRQAVGQLMSALIARELDLLASPARPALVTLNGRFQGVYVLQPDIDESLLRRLRRLPGDVLVGDPSRRVDRVEPYRTYLTEPSSWRRVASSGRPTPSDEEPPLARLIRLLNAGTYWAEARRPLDEDYYVRFLSLIALLGTCHYDSIHNLVLYLDPLSGRFQQFEWDSEGGPFNDRAPDWVGPDVASNLIFRELLADPAFRARRDAYLYRLLGDRALLARLDAALVALRERLVPWLRRDRLDRASFNFLGPDDPAEGIEQWRRWLRARATFLRDRLARGSLRLARRGADALLVVDGGPSWEQVTLSFARPVSLSSVQVRLPGEAETGTYPVRMARDGRSGVVALALHPGRVPAGSVGSGRLELAPAPHLYTFEGLPPGLVAVEARNGVTRAWAEAAPLKQGGLPRRSPWRTLPPPRGLPPRPLGLTVRTERPLVVSGTPERPRVLEGTVALLGSRTSGSRFRHVVFRNNRPARALGIDLLGGVNVHEARDVVFEDCTFVRTDKRLKTEDMLRVARGQVTLRRCRFVDAYSDALDLDFTDAVIEDCRFERPGNDGIDLMGSDARISGCVIRGAGDKGISIGEGSHPVVVDTTITGATIAVEAKDGSDPLLVACRLQGATAVHAYAKNWRYADGGHGRIVSSIVQGPVLLDGRSDLQLIGCRLEGPAPKGAVAVLELGPRRTPDRRVEASLGLAPAPAPGPVSPARRPRPLRPVWRHRFEERLTSSLHGWSLHPPRRRGPSRWFVGRQGLELRRRSGAPLTLRWAAPAPVALGAQAFFVVEAQADAPVDATVVLTGDGEQAEQVRLRPRFVRHLIPAPPGPLRRIELRLPGGTTHVRVRRVALLGAR